jgi:hypothetical protein
MRQTPPNGRETISFKIADEKIEYLLRRLKDKNVCPCCVARALTFHAASLVEGTLGSAKAIEVFEAVISKLHEHDVPPFDPSALIYAGRMKNSAKPLK